MGKDECADAANWPGCQGLSATTADAPHKGMVINASASTADMFVVWPSPVPKAGARARIGAGPQA